MKNKKIISLLSGIVVSICVYFLFFNSNYTGSLKMNEEFMSLQRIIFIFNCIISIWWGLMFGLILFLILDYGRVSQIIEKQKQKNDKLATIKTFEDTLNLYKLELVKNPNSTFLIGVIKNTEEYINELKTKLNQ
jgi:amino acid transporter